MTDQSRTYPLTLEVVQEGGTLSGRWSGTSPDGADEGEMIGTYSADGIVAMTWRASEYYNCPLGVKGTVSGEVMTAEYGTVECSRNAPIGTLTVTRKQL
jgi:hypothetical protein